MFCVVLTESMRREGKQGFDRVDLLQLGSCECLCCSSLKRAPVTSSLSYMLFFTSQCGYYTENVLQKVNVFELNFSGE